MVELVVRLLADSEGLVQRRKGWVSRAGHGVVTVRSVVGLVVGRSEEKRFLIEYLTKKGCED